MLYWHDGLELPVALAHDELEPQQDEQEQLEANDVEYQQLELCFLQLEWFQLQLEIH